MIEQVVRRRRLLRILCVAADHDQLVTVTQLMRIYMDLHDGSGTDELASALSACRSKVRLSRVGQWTTFASILPPGRDEVTGFGLDNVAPFPFNPFNATNGWGPNV